MKTLEKIIKSGKQIFAGALLAGALAFNYGCGNSEEEIAEQVQPESNYNEPVTENFAITYPISGGTAPSRITMTGVGIKQEVASYSSRVHTDKWYTQVGTLNVENNGSWTYSPVYLSGNGIYNNHTIEMKVDYVDGTKEEATVSNVVRP